MPDDQRCSEPAFSREHDTAITPCSQDDSPIAQTASHACGWRTSRGGHAQQQLPVVGAVSSPKVDTRRRGRCAPLECGRGHKVRRSLGVMAAPPQEVHVPNNLIVVIIKEIIQRVIASFLHDTVEFVRVDLAISVTISLVNHVLQLLLGHILAELLGYTLEILERNLSGVVVIEELEHLEDLLLGVLLAHLSSHHLQKLRKLNLTRAVGVNVGDHFTKLLFLHLEAKGAHRRLELTVVD
mmetsp:Transcript_36388/g.44448  ORF Transcript_36388/g.44448 Transcript_36388/m.44448 type:complete len:239 (-) Transcript_36388:128-844(-)